MLSFCVNRPPPKHFFFFPYIGKTSLIWFWTSSFFPTPPTSFRWAFWFLRNKTQDYIKYSILHVACTWWWWFSHQVVSNSCNPMDCSLSGFSVHGTLQARIMETYLVGVSRKEKWIKEYVTEWLVEDKC